MIVAVKRNKKQNLLKILSLLILIIISTTYYFHMKKVNEERQLKELELKQTQKLKKEKEEKEEKEKKQFEKAILTEIEKAIDLIGQENVQNVKIIDDKVILRISYFLHVYQPIVLRITITDRQ